jgi:catechol 2,3-dioxygenase-like lactoylglutathione lyase family enzyme
MMSKIRSIRPFIGSRDFKQSRRFYTELGFSEYSIGEKMSVFQHGNFGFYLQDYDVAEWIDNSMLFLEVEDIAEWHRFHQSLDLASRYPGARLSEIVIRDWGSEYFLHDPSGILWHVGTFREQADEG